MENLKYFCPSFNQSDMKRCGWATEEELVAYHDNEYGVIKANDSSIFEQICFEILGAGRVSISVIQKRNALKDVFYGYNIEAIANMPESELKRAAKRLEMPMAKLSAMKQNAEASLRIKEEYGSLFKFIYGIKRPDRMLFALKSFGFSKIGIVTVTSLMKALGIIEAHEKGCFRQTTTAEEH